MADPILCAFAGRCWRQKRAGVGLMLLQTGTRSDTDASRPASKHHRHQLLSIMALLHKELSCRHDAALMQPNSMLSAELQLQLANQ